MKKLSIFILSLLTVFTCLCIAPNEVDASGDLDYIEKYEIVVEPYDNGNLHMTYHIVWDVLDSSSEGPLSWVKIGIWNSSITGLTALSDNIVSIERDGETLKIYFDRDYYAGESVDFAFSFTQQYCATINEDTVEYRFNPGWFNEIIVGEIRVEWKMPFDECLYTNCIAHDENTLVWTTTLGYGETINVDVKVNSSFFSDLDTLQTYANYQKKETIKTITIIFGFFGFFVLLIVLICLAVREESDGYDYYCGFSGRSWYHHHHHPIHHRGFNRKGKPVKTFSNDAVAKVSSSGSGRSSGSSCACACACACAGGGRAGCSRKDFTEIKKESYS